MLGPLPAAHRAGLLVVSATVGLVTGLWIAVVGTIGALGLASPGVAAVGGGIAVAVLGTLLLVGPPGRRRA